MTSFFFCLILNLLFFGFQGQQATNYFDFWEEGHWVSCITVFIKDTVEEKDKFIITKLENKNAFDEVWDIFIGDDTYVNARVLRAFDQESQRWKLFYVDDQNAQIWDSSMIKTRLYFFKTFLYNDQVFYSRQSWFSMEEGQVIRTIERSIDQKNWSMRYWQLFRRNKE